MTEQLTKDQQVDAAVCRIAETHFDDAAMIERYMTELEKQLTDAAKARAVIRRLLLAVDHHSSRKVTIEEFKEMVEQAESAIASLQPRDGEGVKS